MNRVANALSDAGAVQADFRKLLCARRVRDQAVGHSKTGDLLGRQAVRDGMLDDG
jgi:hypothetical protein